MGERDESTNEETGAESPDPSPETQDQPSPDSSEASGERAEASGEPQDEGTVEAFPDEADRLRGQLEESSARLRAVSKAYKDLQAEMDAFRRRQQVLAETKAEKRAGQVVERFFEPVQNLKRALEQKDGSAEDLRQGVQLVLKQFVDRMDALGLAEIPGVGSAFDPKVHDALAQMPVTDASMNGKVIEVYATGWKVGDRVIQPAQVIVGVYQEPGEA